MNKKLATLMFALGIGIASAPAIAFSCESICKGRHNGCLAGSQYTTEECDAAYAACQELCYGCGVHWNAQC